MTEIARKRAHSHLLVFFGDLAKLPHCIVTASVVDVYNLVGIADFAHNGVHALKRNLHHFLFVEHRNYQREKFVGHIIASVFVCVMNIIAVSTCQSNEKKGRMLTKNELFVHKNANYYTEALRGSI